MPNIIVTDYCNLNCSYCFANNQSIKQGNSITLEQYSSILDFFAAEGSPIGIIGGEPTLHPQFKDIITLTNKYCAFFNTRATLFTNGIELAPYLSYFGDNIDSLININDPADIGYNKYNKILFALDKISDLCWFGTRVTCGVNLHPNKHTYEYIWDIVDTYNLQVIRASVVSPCGCYHTMKNDKDAYYNLMKPIFIRFCQEAEVHHCKIFLDCNYIPLCYFNEAEQEHILRVLANDLTGMCQVTIDIDSQLQAYPCYGSRTNENININLFENVSQLERYFFISHSIPKAKNNNINNKCQNCEQHLLFKCQGGCLGFAS